MRTPTTRERGFGRIYHAIGGATVLALLVTGCGSDDAPAAPAEGDAAVQDAEANVDEADVDEADAEEADVDQTAAPEANDGAASGQMFVDAFEEEGLNCAATDPDRFGPGVVEQFGCQGDDHLVMSIRDYEDAGARDEQLGRIQALACEIADQGQEIQRVTVSDTWIVMAGGDRDVDFEVFGNAMTGLGLDWSDYTC